MTETQAIAAIVLSFAVPFAVQLIKTEAMTGKAARILALGCSLLAGVVTGFVGGVPADPGAWVTCAFAVVGGRAGGLHAVQVGRHHIQVARRPAGRDRRREGVGNG